MTYEDSRGGIMAHTAMDTRPITDQAPYNVAEQLPAPAPALARPAWSGANLPRARRLWTAALCAALLITAGGLGMLYVDDSYYQNSTNALTSQTEQLAGRNQELSGQLTSTQHELTSSQAQVTSLSAELQHPTLGIWNVPQTISGPDYYLAAGVPDTFTYHLKLTASGPISVSILSVKQFGSAVTCVQNGVGLTFYCMNHSGSTAGWLGVTSVNFDFHLAEGCAAYIAVITAASRVTVTPDVSVTYNPASSATGACA